MIGRAWAWVTQRSKSRQPCSSLAIMFDAVGFTLGPTVSTDAATRLQISWGEVQKVAVFKRDLYVVDMVCLLVELPGPRTLELNEEMQGWQAFIESLPQFLVGITPWHEWFLAVAFPAFKANPTLIFTR